MTINLSEYKFCISYDQAIAILPVDYFYNNKGNALKQLKRY